MREEPHTVTIGDAQQAPRDETGLRWYAVHTQPASEVRALTHLKRQAYTVFCPRYRKTVRHARRKTSVLAPLFPAYLFVALDISRDRWRSINGTRGVVRLIAHGDVPQPVPHGAVEALQAHTGADGVMDLTPSLSIGQAVRVADGPFSELVGTLERLDGDGRVCVLFEILGRSVSVSLPGEALDSAA